jgi:hypothetical protein
MADLEQFYEMAAEQGNQTISSLFAAVRENSTRAAEFPALAPFQAPPV